MQNIELKEQMKQEELLKFNSSEEYIKYKLKKTEETGIYIAPDITEKKIVNAARYIANDMDPMFIIGIQDITLFGSSKEGVVFTGDKIYIKAYLKKSIEIKYDTVDNVLYENEITVDDKGNEKERGKLVITYKSGEEQVLYTNELSGIGLQLISEIIDGVLHQVSKIETSEQLIQLRDLGDDVIELYLKIVVNYFKDQYFEVKDYNDDLRKSYIEIISLISRLNVTKELANKTRDYRLSEDVKEDTQNIIVLLKNNIPKGSRDTIFQSLINDILLVKKDIFDTWKKDPVFLEYKNLLSISDEQVEFFIRKARQDEVIIAEKIDDEAIKRSSQELIAVGGAAGVSLAALAVTGGISTGIWGGLITLGMASTGGMLLGLAIVGGLGYGAYRGIKHLAGTSELEKYGIKISMLQERITLYQKSQNEILLDINWITKKIETLVLDKQKIEKNYKKITSLLQQAKNLNKSSELMEEDHKHDKCHLLLTKLPNILDVDRYKELSKCNIHGKTYNEFVFQCYVENDEGKYQLEDTINVENLEKLYQVLENVGYYNTQQSIYAQGKVLGNKGLNFMKGLLE